MYDHPITKKLLDNKSQSIGSTVTDNNAGDLLSQTLNLNDEIQYASFSNRLGAHISDSIYFTLIGLPLKFIIPGSYNPYDFSNLYDRDPNDYLNLIKHQPSPFEAFLASVYSFAYVYTIGAICRLFWIPALQSSKKQSSWGQRYQDIYICTKSGQRLGYFLALGRYCLRILSFASIIGILFIIWDKKRRALHDIICGTEVRCRPTTKSSISQQPQEPQQPAIEIPDKKSSIIPEFDSSFQNALHLSCVSY